MANEKLFTAKQAAEAVLAKAADMLAKGLTGHEKGIHLPSQSEAGTSTTGLSVKNKFRDHKEGVAEAKVGHKETLKEMKSMPKPKLDKSEGGMKAAPATDKNAPGETAQDTPAGVKASPDPGRAQPNENGNPAPGALPQNEQKFGAELKGHLKLAKFVGRMEEKRKGAATQVIGAPAAAAAPQMTKGEGVDRNAGAPLHRKADYDKKGDKLNSQIAAEGAKDNHVKKLAEIKAAPKPKLPV